MKTCKMCGETKPYDEFYKDKRNNDGRQSRCKVCHRSVMKKFREDHPARAKAIAKLSYERHQEKRLARQKEYYQENREKRLAYYREWCQTDRGKLISAKHRAKRRAMKLGVKEDFTEDDIKFVLDRAEWRCEECGMTNDEHLKVYNKRLHIDHVSPLIEGNKLTHDNAQVLCQSCNSSKPKRTC